MRMLAAVLALVSCSPAPARRPRRPPASSSGSSSCARHIGAPGVAIAIVENGKVDAGARLGRPQDRHASEPVDADTIFATGSTGKAFTVAALAMLVDAGQDQAGTTRSSTTCPTSGCTIRWVTREMTIRDLLVHRSGLGLGAGDLLFVPHSTLTREETVRRLRYIKPATSFRSGYAYDNILYMVAGPADRGGQRPDLGAVRPRARLPAARNEAIRPFRQGAPGDREPRHAARPRPTGRSSASARKRRSTRRDHLAANAAPAGGLAISANDMTRWLLMQLAAWQDPGQRRAAVLAKPVRRDVDAGHAPADRRLPGPSSTSTQPNFYALCAWLGRPGLSRRQAHLARRRGVRLAHRGRAAPGPQRRHLHRGQQRGRRDRPRAAVRAARPLSRASRRASGRRSSTVQDRPAERGGQGSCRRRRPRRRASARRCRSTAMPATIPTPGTARSRSAARARA